jgi:hypothetical protein
MYIDGEPMQVDTALDLYDFKSGMRLADREGTNHTMILDQEVG